MSTNTVTIEVPAAQAQAFSALLALLSPEAPAKVTKARKVTPKAPAKVKYLTKANRKAFIKAHAWAQDGMSTGVLATMIVNEGRTVRKGWALGDGYRALVTDN